MRLKSDQCLGHLRARALTISAPWSVEIGTKCVRTMLAVQKLSKEDSQDPGNRW